MKLFVKRSHLHGEFLGFFVAAFGAFIVCLYLPGGELSPIAAAMVILAFFALGTGFYVHQKRVGLYISGTDIYYKELCRKVIQPQEIKAIRISKAYRRHKHGMPTPIKDIKGNQLYSMFLLHTYYPWAMHNPDAPGYGDLSFKTSYRQCMFSCTVYDQNAVDYLKTLNPDIVVIPPEGSEPERVTRPVRGWIKWVTRKDWTPYRPYNEKKEEDESLDGNEKSY